MTRVPQHGPRVYVLLDPDQDYEESTRVLAVSGSLQASKLTAARLRRTRRTVVGGWCRVVEDERSLTIELRTADVVLRRWTQQGTGLYRPDVGPWTCNPTPTPENPEVCSP